MIFNKRLYRELDKTMIIVILAVMAIGLLTIQSATSGRALLFNESFLFRQMTSMAIGLLLVLLILYLPYQRFIDIAYIFYGLNLIILVMVLVMGHVRLGAQRWISIGGFAFQPSEFIKLNLILALANYLGWKKETMWRFENILIPLLLVCLPFGLVLLQPDLGTGLLLMPVFFAMLLAGGARPKYVAGIIGLGLAGMPFFWHFLREYQKQRLLVFINPNIDPLGAGYTIIQSKIAVGSGGLIGKGWLAGTQNQLNFLPERHTDFIFSVIGEEWGLLGALALLLLYIFIIKKAFDVASSTSDIHGKLIATGVATMLGLQVIINIGMTIGLMPVVGVPLPMVSYGGSSMIATLVALGLVLNVGMRRSTF